jgi:hypothetical protein
MTPWLPAGAVVGSLSNDELTGGADLDLMFGVTDDVPVPEVLEDWSQTLVREVNAVKLFDLSSGPITYRVFLLPGLLELPDDVLGQLTGALRSFGWWRAPSCAGGGGRRVARHVG